jgi:hypothetical protein
MDKLTDRYHKKQGLTVNEGEVIEAAIVYWDKKSATSNIPQARFGSSLVPVENKLWLYGGKGVVNYDDIH